MKKNMKKECAYMDNLITLPYSRNLEKEMATHSSILLAWKVPWTDEPAGLQGQKELDMTEYTHPRQKLTQHCKSTILQNNKKRY